MPIPSGCHAIRQNENQEKVGTNERDRAKEEEKGEEKETGKEKVPLLSFPGGGIYFYWQLGVIKYLLANQYDLGKVQFVGASAGALTSTLVACDVDIQRATNLAIEMSHQHEIWQRGLGLVGVWGNLVEEWLDALLPMNAHEICNRRIHLFVTKVGYPYPQRISINHFHSREELIKVNMASVHIPYVMNKRIFRFIKSSEEKEKKEDELSHLSPTAAQQQPTQIKQTQESPYLHNDNDEKQSLFMDEELSSSSSSSSSIDTIVEAYLPDPPIASSNVSEPPQHIPIPSQNFPLRRSHSASVSSSPASSSVSSSVFSSFSSSSSLNNLFSSSFLSFQKMKEEEPTAPKFSWTSSEYIKSSPSMSTIASSSSCSSSSSPSSEFTPTSIPGSPSTGGPSFLFSSLFGSSTTKYKSNRNQKNIINLSISNSNYNSKQEKEKN